MSDDARLFGGIALLSVAVIVCLTLSRTLGMKGLQACRPALRPSLLLSDTVMRHLLRSPEC